MTEKWSTPTTSKKSEQIQFLSTPKKPEASTINDKPNAYLWKFDQKRKII